MYIYHWTTVQGNFNAPLRGQEGKLIFSQVQTYRGFTFIMLGELTLLSDTSSLPQEHNNSLEAQSTPKWLSSIVRHATAQPGTGHVAGCGHTVVLHELGTCTGSSTAQPARLQSYLSKLHCISSLKHSFLSEQDEVLLLHAGHLLSWKAL